MPVVMDNVLLLVVLVASVFAPLSGWFATQRARQPVTWFVLGALIGPLALALLAIAPPGRCPSCRAPVEGWPTTCSECGRPLHDGIGSASAPTNPSTVGKPNVNGAGGVTVAGAAPRPRRARFERPAVVGTARAGPRDRVTRAHAMLEVDAGDVLATGIYLSGNAGLDIGARYALSRISTEDGDRLRVFGPVDAGQIMVRHEGPLEDFDVIGVEDRLIIEGRDGRSKLRCVLGAVGGMRGEDLQRALNATAISPR